MDQDPFEFPQEMFSQVPLFAEIAKAMSWQGGPINWDMARQVASAMAASDPSPPVISEDIEELAEAGRLGGSWLADATGFPTEPAAVAVRATTPRAWVEQALRTYTELLDPLGAKLSGALKGEPVDGADQMGAVLEKIMPLFTGIQCGSILGTLGRTALSGYDVPLPVEDEGVANVLVAHVDAHARDFSLDRREMRYWAALHASAHRILFDGFAWMRAHFWSLYHSYLAAIDVNLADTLERLQALDISNPDQLQSAMGENLFGLSGSDSVGPSQGRLQAFISVIEAAADRAVADAARGKLVAYPAIKESLTRRETAGERALSGFTGLDIPAAMAADAGMFCAAVIDRGGWPLLNGMWEDTEKLPSAEDLADPSEWLSRHS